MAKKQFSVATGNDAQPGVRAAPSIHMVRRGNLQTTELAAKELTFHGASTIIFILWA